MSTARLRVSLDALARNYRTMRDVTTAVCGAVVKADGYGLGAAPVAKALVREGCRHLFVATVDEGLALRPTFPGVDIYVFAGPADAAEAEALAGAGVTPVINHAGQLESWRPYRSQAAALHVDTGMHRLGFSPDAATPKLVEGFSVSLLMTHLACGDTPDHPLNRRQIERFEAVRRRFPGVPTSIGNSAGTLNGTDFQGDVARPGIGLYGGNPYSDHPNPMQAVAALEGRVLQLRTVEAGETIGYGGTFEAERTMHAAVVGLGYADGLPRLLSNQGAAALDGVRLPIVGRVSMDLTVVDASAVADRIAVGDWLEFFGTTIGLDEVAAWAGTISYEVLTGLGGRLERRYDRSF